LSPVTLFDPSDRVHVWIFALQTCQTNAGLSFFERHGVSAVGDSELRDAVQAARAANDQLGRSASAL
jgi:hypothetical protein